MRLSILIGAAHITIALAALAWLERGRGEGLSALGWIAVIAGGLGLWLGEGEAVPRLATLLLGGGLVAIRRRVTAPPTPATLAARLGNRAGPHRATKLFGDLLSYLRLFALGLASASLVTFSRLALGILHDRPGIGVLARHPRAALRSRHQHRHRPGERRRAQTQAQLHQFFGWGLPEEGLRSGRSPRKTA
ncbi:MAG: hypothetical protein R3C69_12560 [Geminicoccaceae bacterium]